MAVLATRRAKKGLLLVEAMICILVLTLAGAGLVAILIGSVRGWRTGTSKETASSQAAIAMQKLTNDIRDARTASVSVDTHVLTVVLPAMLEDPITHERAYDPSSNDPVPRSYFVQNGSLVKSVGGVTTVIGQGVSEVVFGANGGTVGITLKVPVDLPPGQAGSTEEQVVGRVSLRNFRS